MTPINSQDCSVSVPSSRIRRWSLRVTGLLAVVSVVACLASCGSSRPDANSPAAAGGDVSTKLPPQLFRKWPKPDFALLLSGSMHGYLSPCGCSRPQIGGLERRYNFVQILRQKGWPLVAVDVGDVPQQHGPANLPNVQGLIKYRYAMKALQLTGYSAVGIGEYEAALPLFNALGEWALNEPSPRVVVANLKDADEKYPEQTKKWEQVKIAGTNLTVGVAGLVGPTVAAKVKVKDPTVKFDSSAPALKAVLDEMQRAKVDMRVLLYQGSQTLPSEPGNKRSAEAVECAKAFPMFDVILCLNEEDEPSAEPVLVVDPATKKKTLVAALGHKGKYVGVVGVYRTNDAVNPFDLRYQLVVMSEDFLTPEERVKDHPIAKLMEDYTRELRDRKYLSQYGAMQHRLQVATKGPAPTYVGTDTCKKCHSSAYDVWKKTPHSHAYQTLVNVPHPSNRQFDGECIVCHTVGFGYQGGFTDAEKTPRLENVGCESCHGPGSEHVNKPEDKEWQALMNEWKAPEDEKPAAKAKRLDRIDHFCQSCHDVDNDVTWKNDGKEGAFTRKWKKIAHPTISE